MGLRPAMQMDTSQDVIVVGGGLAGAVAALCLGRMGMKVTILEKFKVPRRKIGETLLMTSLEAENGGGERCEECSAYHLKSIRIRSATP